MLASIEIKNFRCFENTNIQGFGRINLVTGKNNSGKTCLLEALYANTTKHFNDIIHNSRSSNRDSAAQNNLSTYLKVIQYFYFDNLLISSIVFNSRHKTTYSHLDTASTFVTGFADEQ